MSPGARRKKEGIKLGKERAKENGERRVKGREKGEIKEGKGWREKERRKDEKCQRGEMKKFLKRLETR